MEKLSVFQIGLLVILYFGIGASIVLSFVATKNIGKEGYDKCIKEKCETKGESFCSKYREIDNCCTGAGGTVGMQGNQYVCAFN